MAPRTASDRITDVHIHIQPWRDLKPQVQAAMRKGKEDHWEFLIAVMDDPKVLLDVMDRSRVWRVGLVNTAGRSGSSPTTATSRERREQRVTRTVC